MISTAHAGVTLDLPDTAADFAEWIRPHLPAMARLAARLAPRTDGDDVVQEALARAWTKREQFDARRGSPSAWLLAITADQAMKARRRTLSVQSIIERASPQPSTDDAIDIERALDQLPKRQRLAVDCFYFVGLSVAETAAVMDCAEGTVKSTLAEARTRLRMLLRTSS